MNKTIEDYMKLPYTIELIPDPEGGWVVAVKELPGCMSQGETPEEAIEMIRDAMRAWIRTVMERGHEIPEPRPIESYSGKFVLRLPRYLHRQLAEEAEQQNVSLNQYINVALAGANRPGAPTYVVDQREDGESIVKWPGLNKAARSVLQMAGQETEAGELDEELFAGWLARMISYSNSAYENGYFQDSLKYLDQITVYLRQHMDRSPIFESIVLLLEFQRAVVEKSSIQPALVQQVGPSEIRDYIQSTYQDYIIQFSTGPEERPIRDKKISIKSRESELDQEFIRIANQKIDE